MEDSVRCLDVEKENTVVSVVVHIGTLKFQALFRSVGLIPKYPLKKKKKTMDRFTIVDGKIHYFYGDFQ